MARPALERTVTGVGMKRTGRLLRRVAWLLPLLAAPPSAAVDLARGGEALLPIVVARDAGPAELRAARELAHYLRASSGASFSIETERDGAIPANAIFVGPTAAARESGLDPLLLGPEEWVLRATPGRLLLVGGRPRGTLYAVYRFLADRIGVRWWTPFEESVPSRRSLSVAPFESRGSPVFAYRDLFGLDGPLEFRARHGLNGEFSSLGAELGGAERYGPPGHVHNFYRYVPPELYFDLRPDFYSEAGGMRFVERGQLCLTNPDLLDLVREKLAGYVRGSRTEALGRGEPPPQLFAFSPNDWGGMCRCPNCSAAAAKSGSPAGPLVEFVNGLADSIRDEYPELRLDSLAYLQTLPAPRGVRLRDNAVIRLSALQRRDFTLPLSDPSHQEIRAAIEGWLEVTPHLRIWDYAVSFSRTGDLPLPNLPALAGDLRYYRDLGIEGVFVQHDYPMSADLRALKQWVLLELIRDPGRKAAELVDEFTRGYYGPAGPAIRRYVEALERQAAAHPAPIRYEASAEDYAYLDAGFLSGAQRLFDRAERKVSRDPVLLRRVRRARLSLDRATLWRWPTLFGDRRRTEAGLDWEAVARRYRESWYTQIGLRMPAYGRDAARAEVEREIAFLEARFSE